MLQNLRTMAGGMDPATGMSLSATARIAAAEKYTAFLTKLESIDAWHEKQQLETDKQKHDQNMDVAKLQIESTNETRRIDLEYDRLQVQKAEIVIRALEIAARNPELRQLHGVVNELSLRLLGGEVVPSVPMLEDNGKK
jgi:hypothetical protein